MMRRASLRAVLIAVVLGLSSSGCSEDAQILDGSPGVHGVVRGRVLTISGDPVSGASVRVFVFHDGECEDGQGPVGTFSSITTSASGTFSKLVIIPFTSPFSGCLATEVVPPLSTGLGATTVTDLELTFRSEVEVPDTVFVEVLATVAD
jgi:hypothetical protein